MYLEVIPLNKFKLAARKLKFRTSNRDLNWSLINLFNIFFLPKFAHCEWERGHNNQGCKYGPNKPRKLFIFIRTPSISSGDQNFETTNSIDVNTIPIPMINTSLPTMSILNIYTWNEHKKLFNSFRCYTFMFSNLFLYKHMFLLEKCLLNLWKLCK